MTNRPERRHEPIIYRKLKYIKKGDILPNGKPAREFWGEVKDVFITMQFSKCIYCETHLERSRIQWDVEHFRPKDGVTEWQYSIPTGPAMQQGYYLLAYDLENYAVACKVCNTNHKGTYFPIANARVIHGASVAAHTSEGSYLLYPLGDAADDPEQHIEFDDVKAIAKNGSLRGEISIKLLDLNREELQIERASWLVHTFWNAYEGAVDNKEKALATMEFLLSDSAPFANCTRCFFRLCQTDIAEANHRYHKLHRILQIEGEMD